MPDIDTIVIGAGHAGLAVSHCLREHSIAHLVLERGEIANSWRHERWDSLTLLTPNWQSRLPGFSYTGDDPDNYMAMPELVDFIDTYAKISDAPVKTQTNVTEVSRQAQCYRVCTDRGDWTAKAVVIASGACNLPAVPAVAANVPAHVQSVTAHEYRNPEQLSAGGVLVVGASATGLQLAQEIHRSGRPVTIAVGEHVRLPRVYRGRDIQWWMAAAGILDEGLEDIDDIRRARGLPSPQLVGSREQQNFDLNAMTTQGIKLAGRLMGIHEDRAQFSGSLRNVCALADLKMGRLLKAIDEWAEACPESAEFDPSEEFARTIVDDSPDLGLDLSSGEVSTILWATGYKPDYSWLQVPVLDRKGRLRHEGGVVDSPGLYTIGLPFMRRRKSSFIHGIEDDARYITGHLAAYLHSGNTAL
jgi:putative flavoprotein involved in K+ transport